MMDTRRMLALFCAVVISCTFGIYSAHAVQSIQRNGYIEQILDDNGWQTHNYLVTDWSKLAPLPDTSEGEQAIFLCMIAAQMLEAGMTWEAYFSYLAHKGIAYELQEMPGPWTVGGDEVLCLLNFSSSVSLYLIDDPIKYAVIFVDSPFEVGGSASIPVALEHTQAPYWILTEDGNTVSESEMNASDIQ